METVRNWIASPHGGEVWLHGLDVLGVVLRADAKGCSRPRGGENQPRDKEHLEDLRDAIDQYQRDARLDQAVADCFSRPRRRSRTILAQDGDDISVEGYIEGDVRRLFERPVREEARRKAAVSIVIDGNCSAADRHLNYMESRQAQAYALVMQCERDGRPCRVVVRKESQYSDRPELGMVSWHFVAKDWDEPMFPALWGAFKNNPTTNDFWNCICAFIVGGAPDGNGHVRNYNLDSLPADEEIIVVDGGKASQYMRLSGGAIMYEDAVKRMAD
jgi:hypothetical protein